MKMTKLLGVVAAVAAAPACVIVDGDDGPPPDPYGDIAFNWSFAGENDCDRAGVDELDIVIFNNGQVFQEIDGEPCVGGGLILTDYFNDRYELEIDAYSRTSELLYSGSFSVRVQGGVENDVGVVEFVSINGEPPPPPPPPPPEVGGVGLFWTFLYPENDPIESCELAGVLEIDVSLVSEDGEEIVDTFNCAQAAGAAFDNLLTGEWTMQVDAYGEYHGDDIRLYSVVIDEIDIEEGFTLELGDVALPRNEVSFADVEAVWSFAGTSCGAEGIDTLTLSLERSGHDDPEDVVQVNCSSLAAVRRTFVPGTYTVRLEGEGDDADFSSVVSADVAPDTTTTVNLQLAPVAP